jgi:hypothetical protein
MTHEIIFALDLITEVKESGTVGMHWSSKPSFSIFSGKFKFLFTKGICCTACLKKIWNKFLTTLELRNIGFGSCPLEERHSAVER